MSGPKMPTRVTRESFTNEKGTKSSQGKAKEVFQPIWIYDFEITNRYQVQQQRHFHSVVLKCAFEVCCGVSIKRSKRQWRGANVSRPKFSGKLYRSWNRLNKSARVGDCLRIYLKLLLSPDPRIFLMTLDDKFQTSYFASQTENAVARFLKWLNVE